MTNRTKLEGSKQIGFRLDADAHTALMRLAEEKGVTASEFFRGVVEKVLAPAQRERDETRAAIEALPPGAQKKALRAIEIQKRLRELRAERPMVHALSSLFHDGAGVTQDAETVRLEAELAVLGKAFEAEVAGPAAPAKAGKKIGGSPAVCRADDLSEGDGPEGDEPEADEPEADEPEADEPEKSDEDREADRFLEVTGLINSFRDLCDARSALENFLDGGPPACNLLLHALERGREGDLLDDELFGVLRDVAVRSIAARTKVRDLEAADSGAAGPLVKRREADLKGLLAKLTAVVEKKAPVKKGFFSNWSIFR